jgi:hypothetical protein
VIDKLTLLMNNDEVSHTEVEKLIDELINQLENEIITELEGNTDLIRNLVKEELRVNNYV